MADGIEALERQLAVVEQLLSERQLEQYVAYPKQLEFHAAGADPAIRERLLIAGNQLGKTLSASREAAMHLTGAYPAWWPGKVFHKKTAAWAGSKTSGVTRDSVQRYLLGRPGSWGTGAIPKDRIVDVKKNPHGVPDAVEMITVKHIPPDSKKGASDGNSVIAFKSYDQEREKWQGETLDFVWFDEEPPLEIYTEGLTRTNATKGIAFMTFTPLLGISEVVKRFLYEKVVGTHVTTMTIEDALHYTAEERARIIATYPPHERRARTEGIPMLGSGAIFPFDEPEITEGALQIPDWWPRVAGMDFGFDHPTAVVWLAWDRDTDTVHVYDCYKRREASPAVHAAVMRSRGLWIPVMWPHDGNIRDGRGSGETLAQQYRGLGANMFVRRATHPPEPGRQEGTGTNSLEASIADIYDRFQTGRLKINRNLKDLLEEVRLYHRKDGKVEQVNDDAISALRTGLMMLRHAITPPRKQNTAIVAPWVPTVSGMGMG